ncbi:Ff.00g033280.m01.CDS01 [Fusarium sp. VM40]|nr:Ff.00g033280.m01.CDS01 [Fusarium sp. VM40]
MNDHEMDHEADRSNSGYKTLGARSDVESEAESPKGSKQRPVHGRAVFITYTQSRVDDPEEFHSCFCASVKAYINPKHREDPDGLQVYGVMDLHSDGKPRYRVLMLIKESVQWRNACRKLRVWITRDGKSVVDTDAIHIKTKRKGERMEKFIEDTQASFVKDLGAGAVLFGKRIEGATASKKEDHWAQAVLGTDDADEAERIIMVNYPRKYVLGHNGIKSFLHTKRMRMSPQPHVLNFAPRPYKMTAPMKKWYNANFVHHKGGQHTSLVLEGPPGCGKTEWALQLAKMPARCDGGWNMDEFVRPGFTHVVLSDMILKDFRYARQFLSCQAEVTMTGKYRRERRVRLGVPVIWTCTSDNSPLRVPALKKYIEDNGVTVVKIKPGRKLF